MGSGFFILAAGIQVAFVGIHPSFFSQAAREPFGFILSVAGRISIPFQSIFLFFCSGVTPLASGLFDALSKTIVFLSPWIYLCLLGLFVYKIRRSGDLSLVEIFILLYIFPLIFWTGFESNPHTLIRIILPITGFLLVSFLVFFKKNNWLVVAKCFLGFLLFVNVFNVADTIRFDDDVLYKKENQELFSWVKGHIEPREHYMFWEPRTLALMTERVGTAPWTADPQTQINFLKRIEDLKIRYLIMIKAIDQPLIRDLEYNPQIFRLVWESICYKIFELPTVD